MAWGPLPGECQEFHGICIQDGMVTQKNDAWASAPISYSHVVRLQCLEWREVGLKKLWSVMSFEPHQYDSTSTARTPTLTSMHPKSLNIKLFTLDLVRRLQKASAWMHRVSYSPILESHLSDAGPAMDNLHLVALSQSHCLLEFVTVGWGWCTWPT